MTRSKQHHQSMTTHFEALEKRELMSASPLRTPVPHVARPMIHAVEATLHAVKAAAGAGTGLTAEYFADAGMTAGNVIRTDPSINFVPRSNLAASLKNDAAAKWTGFVQPASTDSYYFSVSATGPVTVTVNGVMLINQANPIKGMVRSATPITLQAGTKYSIIMTYQKAAGASASVKLLWAGKHVKQQVVPETSLYPSGTATLTPVSAGVIGQYFIGDDFQTPVLTRVDPTIDFSFGTASPNVVIPGHTAYSILWTGQVTAPTTGTYKLASTTDTNGGVRVSIGGSLLIDTWSQQSTDATTASIALTAGQVYDLKVQYFHNGKRTGSVKLQWAPPGQGLQDIAAGQLTSTPAASAGVLTALPESANEIDLTWTGSTTAAAYLVQHSTDNGTTFQTLATVPAGTTTYADTGLTPVTGYEFKVVPTGSADTSTPSNTADAMTLTETPSSLIANTISSTEVDLTWANVTGADGYDILAMPETSTATASELTAKPDAQSPFTVIGTAPAGANTFAATGLQPGTQYVFEVAGINSAGAPSLPTTPAPATTTPAGTSVTKTVLSSSAVQITWSAVQGATGYAVQTSPDGGITWTTITTVDSDVFSFIDAHATPGLASQYRVLAVDAGGTSAPSNPVTAVSLTDAPATVTASPFSSSQIDLTWTDVPNENGFVVLLDQPGTIPVQVATTGAGVLTASVTGLLPGQSYRFEVESVNSGGADSAASPAASATTPTIAPTVVTALGLTATSAVLNWTDTPGETGFTVESASTATGAFTTLTTLPAGTLTYTDTTLTAGQTRFYRIRGIDAGGPSAPSIVVSALTIPASPAAAVTGLSGAQSQVSWAAVPGATSYTVQRSTSASGTFTTVSTVTGTNTAATVANLLPSTAYFYQVIAGNGTGTSAPSTAVGQMTAPVAQYQRDDQFYGLTAGANLYDINMSNGTSTLIGQAFPGAYALRRNPNTGDLFYYYNSNGITLAGQWDPTTGDNSSFTTAITNPWAGAFREDGVAYVVDHNSVLSSVAVSPHVATTVGTIKNALGQTLAFDTGNMAFNDAGVLYLVSDGTLYTVNTTTAVATLVVQLTYGNVSIAFGNNDEPFFTTPTGTLYSLNLTSLVSTLLGTGTADFTDLASDPQFDDLSATITSGSNSLTPGQTVADTILVSNAGPDTETGPTVVTVTLPAGISFVSAAGTGWTSSASGSVITLTYTGLIATGSTAPALTMDVAVAANAIGIKLTTAAVDGQLFDTATPLETGSLINNVT